MKSIILLSTILILSQIQAQNIPVLPNEFQLDFNQTASFVGKGQTKGTIYLDFTNNRQVVTRQNGRYDRYCGTVFKFTDTPCNHIIVQSKLLDMKIKDFQIFLIKNIAVIVVIVLMAVEFFCLIGLSREELNITVPLNLINKDLIKNGKLKEVNKTFIITKMMQFKPQEDYNKFLKILWISTILKLVQSTLKDLNSHLIVQLNVAV